MPRPAKLSISVAELPGSAITTVRVTIVAGLALAVELDEMDRLVEGHALADAQGDATGHQRGIERDHGVVLARVDRAERRLSQDGGLLERLGERDAPRRRQP